MKIKDGTIKSLNLIYVYGNSVDGIHSLGNTYTLCMVSHKIAMARISDQPHKCIPLAIPCRARLDFIGVA
jgi:hypothetical protein